MKLLKSFLLRSYDMISYYGLGEVESHDDRDFVILLNRYIVLCFVIIIFHSFSNIIFLGLTKDSVFLFVFSMILLFCWFSFSNIIRKGYFISAVLVILTAVVTYYSSFCGVESGMYLFYFPLLSCLPVFFSFKKDKISAVFIFVLIIVSLYVSAFTNFTLVEKNPFLGTYAHQLLIINISSILLLVAVNFFLLLKKELIIFLFCTGIL
nr:hypothetical protein [uncultured Chryseobacterium sp.]